MDNYEYHEYLKSEEWKFKRDARVLFDGKKCVICGRPFDLNVHHLTYKHVPYEQIADIITLCDKHHAEIEKLKKYPGNDSYQILQNMIASQFCKEHEQDDVSNGGQYDLCNGSEINKLWFPFLKERIGTVANFWGADIIINYFNEMREKNLLNKFIEEYKYRDYAYKNGDLNLTDLSVIRKTFAEFCKAHGYAPDTPAPWREIRDHFKYERYEVILRYYDQGAPKSRVTHETKFSNQMITKIYNNPEKYRIRYQNKKDI